MKRILFLMFIACLLAAAIFAGCKEDAPASLFDPSYVGGPPPVVTGILPPTDALANVTTLTITGTNFVPDPARNLVFFDKVSVPILQASATQLVVKAPDLPKDSIIVKVSAGSDLFSSPVMYRLGLAADERFAGFGAADAPAAIECDTAGNLYVSMVAGTAGVGVKRIAPDGTRTDYSPIFSSAVDRWRGMKFGPRQAMFAVQGRNIIFRIPPGGGAPRLWLSGRGMTALNDLDFDSEGNMYAAGAATANIFRIRPDSVVQAFPFVGTVRSVRVFSGYLYVAGNRDLIEKVWRFPISTGGILGAEEEYFVYSSTTAVINAITFSAAGDMFVGTTGTDAMLIVHPNKSVEIFYPGVLVKETGALAWGKGRHLFQARVGTPGPANVIRIDTQMEGAPYYGRLLP